MGDQDVRAGARRCTVLMSMEVLRLTLYAARPHGRMHPRSPVLVRYEAEDTSP